MHEIPTYTDRKPLLHLGSDRVKEEIFVHVAFFCHENNGSSNHFLLRRVEDRTYRFKALILKCLMKAWVPNLH